MKGRVTHWNRDKKYGFIHPDDRPPNGPDVFVHVSGLIDLSDLEEGQTVEYEAHPRSPTHQAYKVRLT